MNINTSIGDNLNLPLSKHTGTWTAATRPSNPALGAWGINTELNRMEIYDGQEWLEHTPAKIEPTTNTIIVANTTTETTIFSKTIDLRLGSTIRLKVSGTVTNATASDDLTIRIKLGSTTLHTFNPAIGNVTDADFHLENDITVRTSDIVSHSEIFINSQKSLSNSTENITGEQTLSVTVQWDNAKIANSLEMYQGTVNVTK